MYYSLFKLTLISVKRVSYCNIESLESCDANGEKLNNNVRLQFQGETFLYNGMIRVTKIFPSTKNKISINFELFSYLN